MIICSLSMLSCSTDREPMVYEEDIFSIMFDGDIDSFRTSFTVYTNSANTTILDFDNSIVPYIRIERVTTDSKYSFKFRYPKDRNSFVVFSCTAISTYPGKYIHGIIMREHNGSVIIEENFYLKSVDMTNMDFTRDDYTFSTNI